MRKIRPLDSRYNTTVQEYIEIIRDLVKERSVARVKDIAEQRGVSRSSVSTALSNLKELGLVEHEYYGYAVLTEEGQLLGDLLEHRHSIILRFLTNILGIPEDTADEEACKLEHSISANTLNALMRFVKSVEECTKHKKITLEDNPDEYCCIHSAIIG